MLVVYVPRPDSNAAQVIAPGSAVVGRPDAVREVVVDGVRTKMVEVYFEGNLYGASNLVTMGQRLAQAAGRLVARYPTTARGWFDEGDLVVVGGYEVADSR